ncbi:MAG: redox-regulated ATPase YchF [Candidatus Pacebacteria bacterium]|nr:redox-regulated ATPase YchF [Candidatus Paceibacterota bacterium]
MSLSIGIVGLPNVGKSTLFNALTKKTVPAENFPFCTIDPSIGVVAVPDERLWKLSAFSNSAKTIPAAVEFVDIAGLVKGAAEGEGLGNQFLSHIREVDVIAQVVRIFEDQNVLHVNSAIDPLSDIETINLELTLADLQTVTKRRGNIEKDVKRGDKEMVLEAKILERFERALKEGGLASSVSFTEEETKMVRRLHLLTSKPILYILNKKAGGKNLDDLSDGEKNSHFEKLIAFFKKTHSPWILVDAKIEDELKTLDKKEKESFRSELGGKDDGTDKLIKKGYEMLSLITFFTTGEDETRGWTIKEGSTAPLAGAAIHTDFRDKFIRADVINWETLLQVGSFAKARERGLLRTEGKEYIVSDGDVVEFKI